MLPVVFQVDLFAKPLDEHHWRYSHKCLHWLLECLVNINREYLRAYPDTPLLRDAGVHYARERGTEDWQAIPIVRKWKRGDCEDLGAWYVAEQRERFRIPAKPRVKFRLVEGFWHYHIQAQLPNGRVVDPSRILGMNSTHEWKPISLIKMIRTEDNG